MRHSPQVVYPALIYNPKLAQRGLNCTSGLQAPIPSPWCCPSIRSLSLQAQFNPTKTLERPQLLAPLHPSLLSTSDLVDSHQLQDLMYKGILPLRPIP